LRTITKPSPGWFDFLFKEWLLLASALGFLTSSAYLKRFPVLSVSELEVLFLLWALFIAAEGLDKSGLVRKCSRIIETGRFVAVKLVVLTFFLSMFVTNDVALLMVVPLTLSLSTGRKGLLVILEALAANAGSALTPFGNPQNLFIYWSYHVRPEEFVRCIGPFSLFFLAVLLVISVVLRAGGRERFHANGNSVERGAYVYGILLVVAVLAVLRLLPVGFCAVVPAYAVVLDRRALRVNYSLLLTFLCLFALAENVRTLLASRLEHPGHIFVLSALASQIMGNVPAALVLARFTSQWKALLWGTNVGGFGSLVGSFANLIAYKLYLDHEERSAVGSFTMKFIGLGCAMFILGMGLYWATEAWR